MLKAKYIPNYLSVSRIIFGLAFLPLGLANLIPWFLGCFAAAGVTDVLDGIIARRFNWQSELGEKLDSIADGVYISAAALTVVFTLEGLNIALYNYIIFAVLFAHRALNMIVTWVRFRRIGFIHTRSSRWASIPIFIMLPISVALGYIPQEPLAVFLVLTTISQLEETFILFAMKPGQYTMSLKSYWEWKRDLAAAEDSALAEAVDEIETVTV